MNRLKGLQELVMMPKKCATAFNLYGKSKRAEIKNKHPKAKYYAIVKEMANSWSKMSKSERN